MKIKTIYQHSLFSFAMVAGLLMATPAQAQFTPGTMLYETNFNGENNSVPADWGRYYGSGNRMDINNNRFYWRRESTGNSAGFFGWYEGSYNGVASSAWADYRVETVFRAGRFDSASSRPAGIVLRWQDDSGPENNNKGYLGNVYQAGEGLVTLTISRDFNNINGQTGDAGGVVLQSETFAFDWANNTFYNLSFEAVGDQLTLSFSNLDQTQGFFITTTDSTYSKGVPGMRTYMSSGGFNWQTEWDSMSVVAVSPIPEPATVGILMGAVSLMSVYLIRRRRR